MTTALLQVVLGWRFGSVAGERDQEREQGE